jgi:mannose-6-phosphate isomerase-like protein (cupin superfamily)
MAEREHGYERGWFRYGFDHMVFNKDRPIHSGAAVSDTAGAFSRGVGNPQCTFAISYPGSETPPVGMHIHRDVLTGEEVEEWYVIIDGTGVMRFTNGDSVAFGPGDLVATYPGTGHSLEVTGDQPVRFMAITPKLFTRPGEGPTRDPWPESFDTRIRILTTNEMNNPLTAECTDCGATWERPEGDEGAHTLAPWAAEHTCSSSHAALHLR